MKEIYLIELENIQNFHELTIALLVIGILFSVSFILSKFYKKPKFFRSFIYVFIVILSFKSLMGYIEKRSISDALKNDEKVFQTCGKLKQYDCWKSIVWKLS